MADLRIEGLKVKYGDVAAVDGVTFTVREGEFVTLLGPSGCGKTTTLRAIAGLEEIDSGTISLGEQVVATSKTHVPSERRDLNMVFQSYAVWPHMTLFENVAYGLRLKGVKGRELDNRVEQSLSIVGLEQYVNRYGTELSGGQQQRVALARAISSDPALILFDEPLSNLDAALRIRMRREIVDIHRQLGKSAVYVTHDQSEALVMSDRIVLMDSGRILQEGTPQDLYERPATKEVAGFMGVEHIWRGQRISDPDIEGLSRVSVQLLCGTQLRLEIDFAARPEDGINGTIGIRSDDVVVESSASAGGLNRLPGRVSRLEYLGSHTSVFVELEAGEVVKASCEAGMAPAVESAVSVYFPPNKFIWITDGPSPGTLKTRPRRVSVPVGNSGEVG